MSTFLFKCALIVCTSHLVLQQVAADVDFDMIGNVEGGSHELGLCQGDCDDDSDCQYGLVCAQRRRDEDVLGCKGYAETGKDYCYRPVKGTTLVLMAEKGKPRDAYPLGRCEGTCDTDSDCKAGLQCYNRYRDDPIPGCNGVGLPWKNYCFGELPELVVVGDKKTDPELYPIGLCEGDCDSDRQCQLGLSCKSRTENEEVNGCSGKGEAGIDYCYAPDESEKVLVRVAKDKEPQDAFPLGICQGDCTVDSDCRSELVCHRGDGDSNSIVPGCSGYGFKEIGYCIEQQQEKAASVPAPEERPKSTISLQNTGTCSRSSKCGKCQGDCGGKDNHCGKGLYCFERSSTTHFVPGCINAGSGSVEGVSYCYEPPKGPETFKAGELTVRENGLVLSTGLTARVIAEERVRVPLFGGGESEERFHKAPDGAGVFADTETGGWIYVSNAESRNYGGVGAITFNPDGEVIDYKMVLKEKSTVRNCGGGKTWWGTWMTCEEIENGQVWEVDPWGRSEGRKTLMGGQGNLYESAAYDNRDSTKPKFFITTDASDGPIVRYTPDRDAVKTALRTNDFSELLHSNATGTARIDYLVLEPSEFNDSRGKFSWSPILLDGQQSALDHSENCEGIDFREGLLYITCKQDKHLFIIDIDNRRYTRSSTRGGAFDGSPDQVARLVGGENDMLYFCEEGGNVTGIHSRDQQGNYYTILEATGEEFSGETTGLGFSPDNLHMYVSYQEAGKIFDVTRTDGYSFGGQRLDIKYHSSPVAKIK